MLSGRYDAAGNQTEVGAYSLAYDAENRQTLAVDNVSEGQVAYGYDGAGQRVTKSNNGLISTLYVYDIFGQLAAEYNSFPKQQSPCATCYLSYDHLGSLRMVTDSAANIISRHDYLPFGEEIPANTAGRRSEWGPFGDKVNQKFTGQERDDETGFDFFQARYFYGAQGTFDSPDPGNAGADPTNPQSWNGYGYAWNNPLTFVDPSGLFLSANPGSGGDEGGDNSGDNGWNWPWFWPWPGGGGGFGMRVTPIRPPPERTTQQPPKTGANQHPGPQLCAGYGTVCFPTTAPVIQPVNWKKFMMYMSCLAGTPPELMAVGSGSPQDSTDSMPETQGPTTYRGNTPGKQKNGGQRPLNPSSRPEVGEAAANAPAYLNSVMSCSAVVANMK